MKINTLLLGACFLTSIVILAGKRENITKTDENKAPLVNELFSCNSTKSAGSANVNFIRLTANSTTKSQNSEGDSTKTSGKKKKNKRRVKDSAKDSTYIESGTGGGSTTK